MEGRRAVATSNLIKLPFSGSPSRAYIAPLVSCVLVAVCVWMGGRRALEVEPGCPLAAEGLASAWVDEGTRLKNAGQVRAGGGGVFCARAGGGEQGGRGFRCTVPPRLGRRARQSHV